MAGEAEDARMYCRSFFFSLFCLCGWRSINGGANFNKGCDCLQLVARREQRCALFSYRGKFVKRRLHRFLKRPQFWLKHMVLSYYENNIWQEHFRILTQTFRFVYDLVIPHLAKQDKSK